MNTLAIKKFVKNSAPIALTVLGAAGFVGSMIFASKAAVKADEVLKKSREENSEKQSKAEEAKLLIPIYIPTVVTSVATIACFTGAAVLNRKQQASIASAYALLENGYKKYKEKLIDIYGEEADRQIHEAIANDTIKAEPPVVTSCNCLYYTEDDILNENGSQDKVLFYDTMSDRYFESTFLAVRTAEYHINRNFCLGGAISINDLYDFLGIDLVEGGDDLGWSAYDELFWIDFTHEKTVLDDGLTYYMFCPVFEPRADFRDY